MTKDSSPSRAARLVRRSLTVVAIAVLIGSVATTTFDSSVALAEQAARAAPARPAVAPADRAGPPARGSRTPTGKLNLNTATASDLELLPGVGPTKAERILAFRTKHGAFKRIADLRRVKGFGKKTLDRLSPFLTLTERTTLAVQ
jgi:competence protein ComEA